MTDAEIVRKMIEKVLSNGWKELDTIHLHPEQQCFGLGYNEIIAVLFDPQFAKGLWGEKKVCANCGSSNIKVYIEEGSYCDNMSCCMTSTIVKPIWKYHQHKLLDEIQAGRNPLLYIEPYLEEGRNV